MSEEKKGTVRNSVAVVIAACLLTLGAVTDWVISRNAADDRTAGLDASKSCGDFQVSGPVRYPPLKVEVVHGNVPCHVARRVMKNQFRGSDGVPNKQTSLSVLPVVDNFNRPDQGPPPGTDWVNEGTATRGGAKVSNNQLVPDPAGPGDYGFAGYQAKSVVPPVAVGFTIASMASAWDHYLKLSVNPDYPTGGERKFLEIGIFNRPDWGFDNGWELSHTTPGGDGGPGPQTHTYPWAVGDRVALTYDGTTVAAWRMKVGTDNWVKLAELTDTSLAGRRLYGTIHISKEHPGNALDDFRFGSAGTDTGHTGLWSCSERELGATVCEENRRGEEAIRARPYCRYWDASIAADWRALRQRCLDTFGPA